MEKTEEEVLAELQEQADAENTDVDDGETSEPEPEPEPEELPGYMGYEEWVAAGKDPDLFKGRKAYEAEYQRIQEDKITKKELAGMRDTLQSVVDLSQQRELDLMAKHEKDLEEAIKQKIDDNDAEGAAADTRELEQVKRAREEKAKTPAKAQPLNPILVDLMHKNPMLDKDSDQFNPEVFADFAAFHNSGLDDFGRDIVHTDAQIAKAANRALAKAKEYNPDVFVSPKTRRAGPGRDKQKSNKNTGVDLATKVKGVVTEDARNPANANAADDIYQLLLEQDPEQAKIFAENITREA